MMGTPEASEIGDWSRRETDARAARELSARVESARVLAEAQRHEAQSHATAARFFLILFLKGKSGKNAISASASGARRESLSLSLSLSLFWCVCITVLFERHLSFSLAQNAGRPTLCGARRSRSARVNRGRPPPPPPVTEWPNPPVALSTL